MWVDRLQRPAAVYFAAELEVLAAYDLLGPVIGSEIEHVFVAQVEQYFLRHVAANSGGAVQQEDLVLIPHRAGSKHVDAIERHVVSL